MADTKRDLRTAPNSGADFLPVARETRWSAGVPYRKASADQQSGLRRVAFPARGAIARGEGT